MDDFMMIELCLGQ